MCITFEHDELKPGVSGLLRVKNDAPFVRSCILSCIDALDELIVVYNDCTDNSAEEIEKMRLLYPSKIKVYPYPHYIMYFVDADGDGTPSALNGIDSIHLLSNYYNFALSKVSYQCAVKIDADQFYFTEELCKLTSLSRQTKNRYIPGYVLGGFILKYRVNEKVWLPHSFFWWAYTSYAKYQFLSNHECLSMSGINVFTDEGKHFVPLGSINSKNAFFYPYNGVGDHLLFWVDKKQSYYKPFPVSIDSGRRYWVIELFNTDKSMYPVGLYWVHRSMMRKYMFDRVKEVMKSMPELFMNLKDFLATSRYDNVKHLLHKPFGNPLYYESKSVRYSHVYTLKKVRAHICRIVNDI